MSTKNDEIAVPIAQAAAETGVSQRTLYNWVKAKKLPARTEGGATVVDLDAVRALAGRRAGASAKAPASAGTPAGNGGVIANGTKLAGEGDGEVAARAFAAFKQGEALEDVIERLKLPAPTGLVLWKQFEEVRAVGSKTGPTIAERMTAAEGRLDELALGLEQYTEGGTLPSQVQGLASDMREIREYLNGLLGPHRNSISCRCGARGYGSITVTCSCCGTPIPWGFFPPTQ